MALATSWFVLKPGPIATEPSPSELEEVAAALERICPGDPSLASRIASQWAYVGLRIAEEEGEPGVRALDVFDDEAVHLFEKNRESFRDLAAVASLDGALFSVSAGPWREAVLEWARSGRLRVYHDYVKRLSPSEQKTLRQTPGALALLGRDAPLAKEMLTQYGARAWGLFMLVDFSPAHGVEDVERVAQSLRQHGEFMLDINERYGLMNALLLVPSPADPSAKLPALFRHSAEKLGDAEAIALFLSNHDDLTALLLDENRSLDDLKEAIAELDNAKLPDELRNFVSDSPHMVRLLLEKREGKLAGLDALKRCGPDAADILFEPGGYAANPVDRNAALLIMTHNGWEGLALLRELRGWGPWHDLLRREDLKTFPDDPLLCRVVRKIARADNRQDEVEVFLKKPVEQIEKEQFPPGLGEQALEWLPGYMAFRTAKDYSRGYQISKSDIGWAVADGVMTATMIGQLANMTIRTIGRPTVNVVIKKTEREAVETAVRKVQQQAGRELAAGGSKQASKTLLTRMPGATLSMVKSLPAETPKLDVSRVARSSAAMAKKVGVRTWGKLDRRIINRGDRRVVIDPLNPEVLKKLGDEAGSQLRWTVAAWLIVGQLAPCILEQVDPGLKEEETSS